MADEKLLKMLKQGLALELWSLTLYEDIVNRVDDKDARKLLAGIIESGELKHVGVMLRAIHKNSIGIPAEKKLSNEKVRAVLKKGLAEELGMQNFYRKAMRMTSDKGLKARFQGSLNDEIMHEKAIRRLIEKLK